MGIMFRGFGGCLGLGRACAVRFWAWVGRVLGSGGVLGYVILGFGEGQVGFAG